MIRALNARPRVWDSTLGRWRAKEGMVSSGYRKTLWGCVEAGRQGRRLGPPLQEWEGKVTVLLLVNTPHHDLPYPESQAFLFHSLFPEAKLSLHLVLKQSLSFPRMWLEGALPSCGLR